MKFHVGHFTYHYNYGKNRKNCGVSTPITINKAVSFIVSLSTAALSHRKPTLPGLPRNTYTGLGNYKINNIWEYEHLHNIFTALKDAFFFPRKYLQNTRHLNTRSSKTIKSAEVPCWLMDASYYLQRQMRLEIRHMRSHISPYAYLQSPWDEAGGKMKIKLNIFIQSTQPTSGSVRFSSWIGVPDADWMGDITVLRTSLQAMAK